MDLLEGFHLIYFKVKFKNLRLISDYIEKNKKKIY